MFGKELEKRREGFREPLGVTQGALVGFVALLLAFGLSMAVDRYQSRRDAVVNEANTVGTTYLRAQTLPEPIRGESLDQLERYTDLRIQLSKERPGSASFDKTSEASQVIQRQLWREAAEAMHRSPVSNAPRLYVETLNEMLDAHTTRVAALGNRVPTSVSFLQIFASALGPGILGMYVAMIGRGLLSVLLAAALISTMLLVMFDLDCPSRGFIEVQATPLISLRHSMDLPPAAPAPS